MHPPEDRIALVAQISIIGIYPEQRRAPKAVETQLRRDSPNAINVPLRCNDHKQRCACKQHFLDPGSLVMNPQTRQQSNAAIYPGYESSHRCSPRRQQQKQRSRVGGATEGTRDSSDRPAQCGWTHSRRNRTLRSAARGVGALRAAGCVPK